MVHFDRHSYGGCKLQGWLLFHRWLHDNNSENNPDEFLKINYKFEQILKYAFQNLTSETYASVV